MQYLNLNIFFSFLSFFWFLVQRTQRTEDVIYSIVRDMASDGKMKTLKYSDARQGVLAKGFTNDQFEEALEAYEELNVWIVNHAKTKITFV